ncbi:MAG: hypothetical protein RL427_1229 [Bacteroidota bacterium]|jgi:hypothetical protein
MDMSLKIVDSGMNVFGLVGCGDVVWFSGSIIQCVNNLILKQSDTLLI